MKVIEPGHVYQLACHEHDGHVEVTFVQKQPIADSAEMETVRIGTTNEEVLRMLIDRLQFLQAKMPCRENAIVITKLEESLMWLEKRTSERKERGVEGTHKA